LTTEVALSGNQLLKGLLATYTPIGVHLQSNTGWNIVLFSAENLPYLIRRTIYGIATVDYIKILYAHTNSTEINGFG